MHNSRPLLLYHVWSGQMDAKSSTTTHTIRTGAEVNTIDPESCGGRHLPIATSDDDKTAQVQQIFGTAHKQQHAGKHYPRMEDIWSERQRSVGIDSVSNYSFTYQNDGLLTLTNQNPVRRTLFLAIEISDSRLNYQERQQRRFDPSISAMTSADL